MNRLNFYLNPVGEQVDQGAAPVHQQVDQGAAPVTNMWINKFLVFQA